MPWRRYRWSSLPRGPALVYQSRLSSRSRYNHGRISLEVARIACASLTHLSSIEFHVCGQHHHHVLQRIESLVFLDPTVSMECPHLLHHYHTVFVPHYYFYSNLEESYRLLAIYESTVVGRSRRRVIWTGLESQISAYFLYMRVCFLSYHGFEGTHLPLCRCPRVACYFSARNFAVHRMAYGDKLH